MKEEKHPVNKCGPRTANYFISFKTNNDIAYALIKYFYKYENNIFLAVNIIKMSDHIYKNLTRPNSLFENIRNF